MEKLSVNKEERRNLESFSSDYIFQNFHDADAFRLRELERLLIAEYFTDQHGSILDLGCGYGRTTVPLVSMGYDVVGIDVVPRMIETAKKEHPEIDYRLMSATDLKFDDASFQYALFSFNGIDCIYPEERRKQALEEIHRVLKPGGICILTSNNRATQFTRPRRYLPAMFWKTFRSGLLFSPYILGSNHGGDQVLFSRMPLFQVRNFKSAGFDVLLVTGKYHTNWLALNLFEIWPYYVLRAVK